MKWTVEISLGGSVKVSVEAKDRVEAEELALAHVNNDIIKPEGKCEVKAVCMGVTVVEDYLGRPVSVKDLGKGFFFFFRDSEPWFTNGYVAVKLTSEENIPEHAQRVETLGTTIMSYLDNLVPIAESDKFMDGEVEVTEFIRENGTSIFIDSIYLPLLEDLDTESILKPIQDYSPVIGTVLGDPIILVMNYAYQRK